MTDLLSREGARHGPRAFARMYRGQTHFDFVGRRRWWFVLSGIIILLGVVSLGVRGLNLGIDFRGGTAWIVQAPGVTQTQATDAAQAAGLSQPTVKLLGRGSSQQLEVQADLNNLSSKQQDDITRAVTRALGGLAHRPATEVSVSHVGPTWGGEVTTRAVVALIAFFAAVVLYISWRFEPKMALAAFIAMVHDLAVALGVYSLAGFQVTPDTVVALLTILGYSLYDTVVVFDRVRENTKGVGSTGRMTYSDMINLSMNQTLARSINTSLVAILPVLAVLVIGAQVLGATTLQDYGLALFVGLLSGAYSSIFIASPVLAILREREPRYAAIRQRLEARGERPEVPSPAAVAMAGGGVVPASDRLGRAGAGRPGVLRPGAARTAGGPRTAGGAGTATTGGDGATAAAADDRATDGGAGDGGAGGPAGPAVVSPRSAVPSGASGRAGRPGAGGPVRPPARPRKGSKPRKRR